MFVLDQFTGRLAACTPHLVTDAIHHDLPEEALKGSLMPRFELLERNDCATQDFLSEIVGVQQAAGICRQTAVRPAPDPGQIAREERLAACSSPVFARSRSANEASAEPLARALPPGRVGAAFRGSLICAVTGRERIGPIISPDPRRRRRKSYPPDTTHS